MKWLAIAATVALGAVALAAPKPGAPAVRDAWADWVGEYAGNVVWRGCTAPGAAVARVTLEATDGAMAIELAALGVRAMSLVERDAGWSGQQGDAAVKLGRAAAGAIALELELASGCTVRGTLKRAATAAVACDRLVGWSRIEARCSKLAAQGRQPLEDAAVIAKTTWRAADATACAARAARLELALIDTGCAPHPDPAIGTRAPDCRRLVDSTERVVRCKTLPRELEDELAGVARSLAAAAQTAAPATLGVVERQCRDAQAITASIAARFSCPL